MHPTAMRLPSWSPEKPLVHIGTLDPMFKGVHGDSYEGHGLSVSECPEAWLSIAQLGGQSWWTLSKSGMSFLDWHATPQESRDSMVAWAVTNGFAESKNGFELSWYDDDHEDRVFTTFANEHEARIEFDAMVDEFEGRAGGPELKAFTGWKLTPHAMTHLTRKCADLAETPVLAAILYCEAMTGLDGVYWADELDESRLSAPRAVIFPGRFGSFERMLQLPEATSANTSLLNKGSSSYDLIVLCSSETRSEGLAEAIAAAPDSSALTDVHENLGGTLHFFAIENAIRFANSGDIFNAVACAHLACANVLRNHGAPARHKTSAQGVEFCFLDTDWSTTGICGPLAQLMRDTAAAGCVDFSQRIGVHLDVGGLMPLSAAFKLGNSSAAQVLLELGCSLDGPMQDFGFNDPIACAKSFGRPNSEVIAAMVTEKLIAERLSAVAAHTDSDATAAANRPMRPQRYGV